MSDQLVEQLRDDIRTLIDNLISPSRLEISRVRNVSSAICRRWLIDKGLVNLAHSLGVVPTLPTFDNLQHIEKIDRWTIVDFYTTGGISLRGFPVNSIYKLRSGFPGHPDFELLKQQAITPGRFLRRKCTFGLDRWFTTEDVLRHMVNKAGGVHFDVRREKIIDQKIDEIRAKFLIGSENMKQDDVDKEYIEILGDFDETFDFVYLEMMSIAQSLCNVRFDGKSVVHKLRVGPDNIGMGNDILLGHTHHVRVNT
ncbi:hypothetical protein GCM10008927_21330 [Amylibacter ulvae]|uniref:Uncharacterized protein n=1 Tax=Paramylibacter ulvae TaxID=1651968 RepID=A0ABQ3D2G1_9RHOB|nr:hypothetical protein [Amylibacter ulvae]GHA55179.1 hypothetical protein GCM10008927_21330 [Amylibacter ulvae]